MSRVSENWELLLRRLSLLSAAVFVLSGLPMAVPARAAGRADQGHRGHPTIPGEIIVGFEDRASRAAKDDALADAGAIQKERFKRIDAALVKVDPAEVTEALKELQDDPRVEYAEPNFLLFADTHSGTPNDPSMHELWGLDNHGQTVNGITGTADADIDAREAWATKTGAANVVVGVIDSGVDFTHADLGGSMTTSPLMWINPGESCSGCRSDGVDNDSNGYVDDWRGWDFVNNDNNPFDDNGHGTHVAGTIGALGNNAGGITGVNWTSSIMALKFLSSSGSGTTANAIKAVLYASSKGAHVTNNSWGGGAFSQALLDAINDADAKGSLFVAAAGNSSQDADATPHYPSGYDAANVISVAATTSSDNIASFSNYGKKSVDLGAPGANIYSTWPGNTYRYANGTSMATPHVAGAAALAKATFPAATDLGIKALLLRTVDPNVALTGKTTTDGRLNVNSAVTCNAAPKVWIDGPAEGFSAPAGEALPVKVIATNCAATSNVAVSATANGTPVTLTARGDGYYTGTYTPTAAGSVTITASATVGSGVDTRSVSGTAVKNYRVEDAAFSWVDAASGGTNVGITKDEEVRSVPLPFTFSFYDQSFSSVNVSSNGFIEFGSTANAWANTSIPTSANPNALVAPFWDDLNPGSGGSVWYKTTGTAPNRRFVVEWAAVPHYTNIGTSTFEVILEEATKDIYFQYQDVNFGDSRYNYGASATVGVENANGSLGKQFSYDQAVLQPYENAKSIRFTMGASTPAAPTGLTATAQSGSSSKIALSWNDVSGEAGYRVERSPNGTTGWAQIATTGENVTTYTDSGLAASTTYHYRVFATNSAGDSAPSPVASATTNPPPPTTPTGLTATAMSSSAIDLSWTDVTGETSYQLERSPDGTNWAQIGTTGQNITTHSDAGLSAATTYYYRVVASNAGGDSAPSTAVSTTTNPNPPATPANLTATPASSSQIDLSWSDVATEDGYRIERSQDGSTNWTEIATTGANVASYANVGLAGNTTYHYRVKAYNTGGSSAASNAASATTGPDPSVSPPPQPMGLTATAASSSRIDLSWTDTAGEDGYRVERSPDGITWTQIGTTGQNIITYSDTGLSPSTTYHYRVVAYNSGGASSPSTAASATTAANPPPQPTGLMATPASSSRIDLSWSDVAGEETYKIERSPDATNWTQIATTGQNVTSYSDTSLSSSTTYHYRVIATNSAGDSAPSSSSSATTGLSSPTPPSGLVATAASSTRIDLSWADVAGEDGYTVERSLDALSWTQIGTTGQNVTTYADTTVTGGTTYHYRVIATNSGGASSPSNTTSTTTPTVNTKSYAASSVNIRKGSLVGDPVANLGTDDGSYFRVAAARQGRNYISDWYGLARIDVSGVTKLTLAYDGATAIGVTQTLYVMNFSTNSWETIAGPLPGSATDATSTWSTVMPASYISGSGEMRLRVATSGSSAYTVSGDMMRFSVEY